MPHRLLSLKKDDILWESERGGDTQIQVLTNPQFNADDNFYSVRVRVIRMYLFGNPVLSAIGTEYELGVTANPSGQSYGPKLYDSPQYHLESDMVEPENVDPGDESRCG